MERKMRVILFDDDQNIREFMERVPSTKGMRCSYTKTPVYVRYSIRMAANVKKMSFVLTS